MKLVKLHLKRDDQLVWINPKNICWVNEYKGLSVITFSGDDSNYVQVSETPEEIVKLLGNAKENRWQLMRKFLGLFQKMKKRHLR